MFSKPQISPMNQLSFLLLHLLSVFCFVQAQPSPPSSSNIQPSLAVVIGIMSVMFTLTFILVVYAKFCHGQERSTLRNDHQIGNRNQQIPPALLMRQDSLYNGIDKTVIESIPFFRFSSLRGSRRGLECVVCLSRFEDVEILRLLPKCKHAFHMGCIDKWLEKHSSCPLCRVKIDPEDLASITYTDSMRALSSGQQQAEVRHDEDAGVELYLQREDSQSRSWSSRFTFRNSLRKSGSQSVMNKQEELPIQVHDENDNSLHKFNHKIIVSDVALKKSWSNVLYSDLTLLNSEMLGDVSSNRFSFLEPTARATEEGGISKNKDEKGKFYRNNSLPSSSDVASSSNQSRDLHPNDTRSMSEITGFSRFKRNSSVRESPAAENGGKEERLKRLWLPIAQRTSQWYGGRDKMSQQSNKEERESLNV